MYICIHYKLISIKTREYINVMEEVMVIPIMLVGVVVGEGGWNSNSFVTGGNKQKTKKIKLMLSYDKLSTRLALKTNNVFQLKQ